MLSGAKDKTCTGICKDSTIIGRMFFVAISELHHLQKIRTSSAE